MSTNGAAIEIEGLSAAYGDAVVLRDLRLRVPAGEVLAVIGPNGAGKSTLMAAISGSLTPTSGQIRRGGRIAMALQEAPLADVSVRRNLELALMWWSEGRRRPADVDGQITRVLAMLGVESLIDRPAKHLSGGQRGRVHLARALVVGADTLLLDEPFAGMDPEMRGDLLADLSGLIRDVARTTVIVVHDRAEAWALADRVAVLLDGSIAAVGTPTEVFIHPPTPKVARFVGFTGSLWEAGWVTMVRPADVAIDPAGPVRATVRRRIPVEDGTLLECDAVGGTVQVVVTDAAPAEGSEIDVRIDGGARFRAAEAAAQ